MRGNRKWFAALLGLVIILTVGCSGGSKSGTDAPASSGGTEAKKSNEPVVINIWGGYPEMDVLYKKAAEDFKKEHPNVTVNVLSMNLRDYEKKLVAALQSDTAAEVITIGTTFLSQFIDAGLIDEAPPEVVAMVQKAYGPFDIANASYKGKLYGVPQLKGQSALFYNKDHFKEAGLDPEKPPQTMDEIIEYAQRLAKYDANGNLTRAGISLRLFGGGGGVTEKFWIIMEQYGGSIVKQTKDGKYHNGYNNDAGRKTLQMHVDLVHKYKADDPKLKRDAEAFELGVASMFFRESWVVGDIAKKAPNLNYGSVRMPAAAISLNQNIFVPKNAKNKDVAWEFVQFLVKPEYQKFMLDEIGWLPLRSKDVNYDDIIAKKPGFKGFIVNDPSYRYFNFPQVTAFDEILTKMAGRLEKAYADKSLVDNPAGIAKAIQEMADETDAILKQNGLYGTD
ncbi:MAG: extracellular solute-binding protein [Bacillota bacterium]